MPARRLNDRLLNDGEEVVADVRPHWWALVGPLGAVVVVIAAGLAARIEGASTAVDLGLLAVVVLAVAWLLVRYLRWATTTLIVTNERLIVRRGVVARAGREIPLEHLSDIGYHQRIFDRLIGAGDLRFESAGRASAEVFSALPHPASIQREIYRQIDVARRRRAGRTEHLAAPSVPDQIDRLDELRRRGILTQAEFDAKKAQLLERM